MVQVSKSFWTGRRILFIAGVASILLCLYVFLERGSISTYANQYQPKYNTFAQTSLQDAIYLCDKAISRTDYRSKVMKTYNEFSSTKQNFGNKADFNFVSSLMEALKTNSYCQPQYNIIVGGVNDGQLAKQMKQTCNSITLYGFEIQPSAVKTATQTLSAFPYVKLFNFGMSDREAEMTYSGGGEGAGLYEATGRWASVERSTEKIPVKTLAQFAESQNVDQFIYAAIDTEGHEPKVIKGMQLEYEINKRRFSAFQYELGGTWAENDSRHTKGEWTQFGTAMYLEILGYELYIIGDSALLPVTAEFFRIGALEEEGYGPFVQGNVLAVFREYASPAVVQTIEKLKRNVN